MFQSRIAVTSGAGGGKGDGTTMSNAEGGNKGGWTQRSDKEGEGCKANDVDSIAIMRD